MPTKSWQTPSTLKTMKQILIQPVITEKMTALSEKLNQHCFIVHKDANKIEIQKAVEEQFGVTVTAVNTINVDGKKKSRFSKAGLLTGRTTSIKKAIVSLADGDTIDIYDHI